MRWEAEHEDSENGEPDDWSLIDLLGIERGYLMLVRRVWSACIWQTGEDAITEDFVEHIGDFLNNRAGKSRR